MPGTSRRRRNSAPSSARWRPTRSSTAFASATTFAAARATACSSTVPPPCPQPLTRGLTRLQPRPHGREQLAQLLADKPEDIQRLLLLVGSGNSAEEIARELDLPARNIRRLLENVRNGERRRERA
jgi:DNA-directed RNA polymerase specialized sigma24 family protein